MLLQFPPSPCTNAEPIQSKAKSFCFPQSRITHAPGKRYGGKQRRNNWESVIIRRNLLPHLLRRITRLCFSCQQAQWFSSTSFKVIKCSGIGVEKVPVQAVTVGEECLQETERFFFTSGRYAFYWFMSNKAMMGNFV
ncbi:hypothetical protein CEXT_216771 [Caerostris extrusa]|uniref:Uncharacterized protein n=1 Tax=Caerostris extrusa TaxID=172846 RepID=A0AAV4QC95_CAEEX|nr:hypothetical protein CEXT_216771 [Caerostris extrusa]